VERGRQLPRTDSTESAEHENQRASAHSTSPSGRFERLALCGAGGNCRTGPTESARA